MGEVRGLLIGLKWYWDVNLNLPINYKTHLARIPSIFIKQKFW